MIEDLLNTKMHWFKYHDPEYPYKCYHGGNILKLRLNDFPAEPLYSLFVNDKFITDLESLPDCWTNDSF